MLTVTISTKGQVVIPASLRKKCGLSTPGKVLLIEREGELVLRPFPNDPVTAARGMLRPQRGLAADHAAYRREERQLEAEHEKNLP